MTCPTCGADPRINPGFCRSCRRADRAAVKRRKDDPVATLRRLMSDEVSLDRAWREFNSTPGRAAAMTVEALMFSLRERGTKAFEEPDTKRRLSELSKRQLKEACQRVQNFKPHMAAPWSREEAAALVSNWRMLRGPAHR